MSSTREQSRAGRSGEPSPGSLRALGVGTWSLIRTTPAIDALRGRLSGSLHPGAVIAASGLPVELQRLALDVVRRTRLWRRERIDVARELISHFAEGLDAGATTERLERDFGSPRAAAALIRRAKKRSRPALWKLAARATTALVLAVVIVLAMYGILAWRYWSGTPSIRVNYLAKFNAPAVAVPPNDRAWSHYRDAIMRLGAEPRFSFELPSGSNIGFWQSLEPGDEGFEEVGAWLAEKKPELDDIRRASAMPHMGYVASTLTDWELLKATSRDPDKLEVYAESAEENPSMIGVLLPQLGQMRRVARVLDADIRHAIATRDSGRIAADVRALLGLARHAAEPRIIISQLVQAAIVSMACDWVGRLCTDHPGLVTERDWIAMAHDLARLQRDGAFRLDLSVEREFFEDILQRTFTDDGAGDGRLTPEGRDLMMRIASIEPWRAYVPEIKTVDSLMGPLVGQAVPGRRETRELHAHLMSLAAVDEALPVWQRTGGGAAKQFVESLKRRPLGESRYMLVIALAPPAATASASIALTGSRVELSQTVIAIELHRMRNGSYPSSLESLAPALLPAVPRDPFDGRAIRYLAPDRSPEWAAGRPVVYSIGNDRLDEQAAKADAKSNAYRGMWAAPPGTADAGPNPRPTPGDWVIFPHLTPPRQPMPTE